MEEKQFEDKLDQTAKRFSDTVSDGVRKIEEAFEKGKRNLREDIKDSEGMRDIKGSPRMGLILLGLGFAWLLHTFGLFDHAIFPIALMVAGLYFIFRSRRTGGSSNVGSGGDTGAEGASGSGETGTTGTRRRKS